jgi:chemotaxis protein methyltransferase CheR
MTGLNPALSQLFSALIEDAAGIYYSAADRELFESKLTAYVEDAGFDSMLDYYYRLRYDDPEGQVRAGLIEALTVHETYFFRELAPLVQLIEGHIADVVRTRGKARIWSAACSTGEEPLTLAMLLDERGLLDRVEVVGTDVSRQALTRARSGRHGRRSLRDRFPPDTVKRYLDVGELGISVAPKIVEAVRFDTLNLVDDAAVAAMGTFDAVLCRNVLFYFRDELAVRVVDRLGRTLDANGVLLVGIAESLLRFGTAFKCEEQGGCFFYRKAS